MAEATPHDPCILTGDSKERHDDCSTHPHRSDLVEMLPAELTGSEILVGGNGDVLHITGEVYRSDYGWGFYNVEVDFGVLRLDADLPIMVLK